MKGKLKKFLICCFTMVAIIFFNTFGQKLVFGWSLVDNSFGLDRHKRMPATFGNSTTIIDSYKVESKSKNKITEVNLGGYVRFTVRMDKDTITTWTKGIMLHANPYTLDRATGTISYNLYPYLWDDSKKVILTTSDNQEEYKQALQLMIGTVKQALELASIDPSPPLISDVPTQEQTRFLEETLNKLDKYLSFR